MRFLRLPSGPLVPCFGVKFALTLAIDAAGLDEMDKRMLRVMKENTAAAPLT
jgi:hypothetical protein